MKTKRLISVFIAAVMIGTTLTACNTGGTGTGTADNSGNQTEGSGDVVEIRFTEWDGGATLQVYEDVVAAFNEAYDNIRVTVMNIPDEYETKLTAMVVGNDIPEISMIDAAGLLFPYAEEGIVLNLNELIENDSSFDSSILMDQFKYNLTEDYLAGYGMGSENITMFYNPALFNEYDVEEPPASYKDAWDWDTFVDNAKQLTIDTNGNNAASDAFDPDNIEQYGVSFGKWWAIYMPFVLSNGSDFLSENGSEIGLTSPAALDALQKLQDLIYVHHVAPTPTQSQNMPGLSEAIATGRVAMQFDGQWSNEALMSDDVSYDVAALPKLGDEAVTVATFGSVAVMNTDKSAAAWEFFKYLLSEGAAMPLYESGLWLPTTAPEYTDEFITDFITDKHPSNYYEAIVVPMLDETAKPPQPLYVRNFNKINDALTPAFDLIWAGEASVADALANVEDSVNAEVSGFFGE